jgi:hypothetical protein
MLDDDAMVSSFSFFNIVVSLPILSFSTSPSTLCDSPLNPPDFSTILLYAPSAI